ncbi:Zn-dependent M28 family amino/carboxypeptidase [Sphingomonas vulcanisoli]|uniref:Zn-dependent M28 family amino/carboxypeptidase n=1 Tax=Sphingomonas vulcanisoli TaxID=1658060 RepID=A0ABX0TMV0_9SPHN|nr:M28 family metallopeptidase [Sphingomonas vulcanisoli]NIJ06423.1 Zn-dependent M28 family amino/carboxypeptidase [Sphingomonas vulcanisoli]
MKAWLGGAAIAAVAASWAAAQTPPAIDAASISQDIKTLSSDDFEGRGPATRGETKTISFVAQRMHEAGLVPAGDPLPDGKHGWLQNVPLLRSEILGQPEMAMMIGGERRILTQGAEIAVRAPMDGTTHIALAGAPLVFVGYGVTAPEKKWDDFKGLDLHGKIIVVLINDPDYETGQGDFGGKAMTYYGRWTYKYEEAARRGAAGVLVVHESGPASYGWNTVKNSNTNAQFDIVRDRPAEAHTPFESWIQRDLAVDLFKASGLDFDAVKKQAQTRAFTPIPLKATLSVLLDADVRKIVSHNVLGMVPGTKHPDETLIYSAHWDHLGIGAPDAKGDKIYNGAVDNASGTAALIAIAHAFATAPKPQRSVVFLSLTAEEKGLLGSEYYATHPVYPLGKTVGVINMDGINVAGPARNFTISGSAKLGLLDDLIAEGTRAGRTFTPEPHPEAGSFYRSDHFSFAKQGVPAISFKSGNDLVEGGTARGEALAADYTKTRYHQPADEWSADWNLAGAVQDLTLLFDLGERLANAREWPEWAAGAEFKAKRDETKGERK